MDAKVDWKRIVSALRDARDGRVWHVPAGRMSSLERLAARDLGLLWSAGGSTNLLFCDKLTEVGAAVLAAWEAWCAKVDRTRLQNWELKWLGRTPQATHTVWRTFYGPWDSGRYKGAPWHIAANPRYLKPGTVVWLEKDRRLCVVTNRGASSNDAAARVHGAEYWVDLYSATRRGDNATQRLWVVGRAPWRH